MEKNRVLIVDDDPEATYGLARLLTERGYEVRAEIDSTKALSVAKAIQPHVVILDFMMPNAHGGDVAWQLASEPLLLNTRMIICSGAVSRKEIQSQLPPARIPILEKPVDTEVLLKIIAGNS